MVLSQMLLASAALSGASFLKMSPKTHPFPRSKPPGMSVWPK